ncbi:MAG: GH116 family glycosyl hydrolase [Janthinobacterium lividum]
MDQTANQQDINPQPSMGRKFAASNLLQIAMPMGGIGAGCICLNGYGGLQDFAVHNIPATSAMPDGHEVHDCGFAVLHIKGEHAATRLLEGPVPAEKLYDQGLQGQGYRHGGHEGLPRFQSNTFEATYPFGKVILEDPRLPLSASVTGWSPFIPNDDVSSGLPCAVLEYTFENRSNEAVVFEFSYHLSHLAIGAAGWSESRSAVIGPDTSGVGGGIAFTNVTPPDHDKFGSASIYAIGQTPKVKASWFRGGWFDAISVLWQEVSNGRFHPNSGDGPPSGDRNGGSLLIEGSLKPGESVTYPLVITWHFPRTSQTQGAVTAVPSGVVALPVICGPGCDCGPEVSLPNWSPFYAAHWPDAQAVALHVAENYEELRRKTRVFTNALHTSTLPAEAVDAVASNLAILKSPTVLRQANGNVWGWEGCFVQSGCCHGSCTHVWNYAQSMPYLFPALERTLREQELVRSIDDRGHVNFRAALPDGPAPHDFHAAADGQLGGILKLYRDFHICGDLAWLTNLYPQAKRSLDYCIAVWDPDRRGLVSEPHHNTYDIEFWGPNGMCSSIYIAALVAFGLLARTLGNSEEAVAYEDLAARGAALMDSILFNGEYYQQNVTWEGLRDQSFLKRIQTGEETPDETTQILQAEGPKYQYGSGCLSDGIIGAWMASIYGVSTPLNSEHVRSTLSAIYRHNFKSDLFDHACLQRPGYALGHEAGLVLCTWPNGGKLTLPFPYSDEVWTGIEYQVASHLIESGMVKEGLALVRAVRSRYEGRTRNPFNEYECGNYYARAMASYALLGSLSGFRYSAADKTLWFSPKLDADPFRSFFSTASAYGIISLTTNALSIEVLEGSLTLERVYLTRASQTQEILWPTVVTSGQTAVQSVSA